MKEVGSNRWQSTKPPSLFSENFNCPDKGKIMPITLGDLSACILDCGQPKEGDVVVVSGGV